MGTLYKQFVNYILTVAFVVDSLTKNSLSPYSFYLQAFIRW